MPSISELLMRYLRFFSSCCISAIPRGFQFQRSSVWTSHGWAEHVTRQVWCLRHRERPSSQMLQPSYITTHQGCWENAQRWLHYGQWPGPRRHEQLPSSLLAFKALGVFKNKLQINCIEKQGKRRLLMGWSSQWIRVCPCQLVLCLGSSRSHWQRCRWRSWRSAFWMEVITWGNAVLFTLRQSNNLPLVLLLSVKDAFKM